MRKRGDRAVLTLYLLYACQKKHVVFRVTGGLAKLSEAFQYAYMQWLPASGYEVAYPFDFELYGE